MANPNIDLGTLNRLASSLVIPDLPELNVTAAFVGKEGIKLSLEGESTMFINTMTGAVTSPEPYMVGTVTVALVKTLALADAYKQRMERNARIGNISVRSDSKALSLYMLQNCAIETVQPLDFSGGSADYTITIKGFYLVNSDLWNLV